MAYSSATVISRALVYGGAAGVAAVSALVGYLAAREVPLGLFRIKPFFMGTGMAAKRGQRRMC
jgi:hypothetical protein